jgi:unsaturated chondroitin disaccharide hydrolase
MSDTRSRESWAAAARSMEGRMQATAGNVGEAFPHWANAETGDWHTTSDGDWTGGAWPGMLWLAHRATGEERYREMARRWCEKLRPRAQRETAFKGFGFYQGAALGDILAGDAEARALALEAAASLCGLFDEKLGLIPLGGQAEEHAEVGSAYSSIDSLQASPLLFWAHEQTGEARYRDCAIRHTSRVLDIHVREDGSVIQSTELDAATGAIVRQFTHKGYSDTSIWGRAQAWAVIYAAMGFARAPEQARWLEQGMRAADWWLAHVPANGVAFWDFDDPAIPATETDTAATAIVCAALLKLALLAPDAARRERYRQAAERSAGSMVDLYLTPRGPSEQRPAGMLIGACFNKRPDARPQDLAPHVETIFGSYYLYESLLVLSDVLAANDI